MAMWSSSFGAMVSVSVSLAVQQLIGLELLLANCIGSAGDGTLEKKMETYDEHFGDIPYQIPYLIIYILHLNGINLN